MSKNGEMTYAIVSQTTLSIMDQIIGDDHMPNDNKLSEAITGILAQAIEEYRQYVLSPAIKDLAQNVYDNAKDIRSEDGKVKSDFEGGRHFQIGMDVGSVLQFAKDMDIDLYRGENNERALRGAGQSPAGQDN